MELPESAKRSWKWITADELLSHGACDLLYILLTSKGEASSITVYNGENAQGTIIATLESLASRSTEFTPCCPLYCHDGLYVTLDANTLGVLVQWQEHGHKGSGG